MEEEDFYIFFFIVSKFKERVHSELRSLAVTKPGKIHSDSERRKAKYVASGAKREADMNKRGRVKTACGGDLRTKEERKVRKKSCKELMWAQRERERVGE